MRRKYTTHKSSSRKWANGSVLDLIVPSHKHPPQLTPDGNPPGAETQPLNVPTVDSNVDNPNRYAENKTHVFWIVDCMI